MPERARRVQEAMQQGVPTLHGDDGGHIRVLPVHGHDRRLRLRAGAVPDST